MSVTMRDLFCGAGGSSLGGAMAGIETKHALNHWDRAIETHSRNFQNADHSCADITSLTTPQIRRFDPTDILWASPECTNHSLAKGGLRTAPKAPSIHDDGPAGDAEQDRSRATMWDVVRFAEQAYLKGYPYKAIITENVPDAVKWGYADDGGLFNAWLQALSALGYEHECVFLNSMMCWPTPQSRDRLYVVFWLKGMRKPNLAIEPQCWCPTCEKLVNGQQTMKPSKTGKPRRICYGTQYFYTCPDCGMPAIPATYAAGSIIDYELPAVRIGDRESALAPNTRERIRRGLERLGSEPFAIRVLHGGTPRPLTLPVVSLTRRHDMSMVFPIAGNTFERTPGNRARDANLVSMDTIHKTLDRAVVFPDDVAVVHMQNHGTVERVSEPCGTMRAGGFHHAVIMRNNTGGAEMVTPDTEPVRSLTTKCHQSVVIPYNRTGQPRTASEPTPTFTTRDRAALVIPEEGGPAQNITINDAQIDDCRFRMFSLDEIAGAMVMANHTDGNRYDVAGNKRERMAQYGNAVTPPAARELVSRVMEVI